jgi:TPR repeat protein
MYHLGQGVRRDDAVAVRWCRKSAEQGDAAAQCSLGASYASGKGIPWDFLEMACQRAQRDYGEAFRWYSKAAAQDYAAAEAGLGFMYYHGYGVQQDFAEAVRWYRKAAEQGNAFAQYYLGFRYYNGQGVPRDYVQAYMWMSLAARATSKQRDEAVSGLDLITGNMTPEQIAEALRLSGEWKPREALATRLENPVRW